MITSTEKTVNFYATFNLLIIVGPKRIGNSLEGEKNDEFDEDDEWAVLEDDSLSVGAPSTLDGNNRYKNRPDCSVLTLDKIIKL